MIGIGEIESRLERNAAWSKRLVTESLECVLGELEKLRVREGRLLACHQRLEAKAEELDQNPHPVLRSLQELTTYFRDTDHHDQWEVMQKIVSRHEDAQMYLCQYDTNTDHTARRRHLQGTFTVLGTMKRGGREQYEIRFYKPGGNEKGTFFCSCPDHKFASKKRCCKHITFLVCRVAQIYDPSFFDTRKLTEAQFETLRTKAENTQQLLADLSVCRPPSTAVTQAMFAQRAKPFTEDDLCPICYDGFEDTPGTVSCPTCTNYVHRECMKVWKERSDTCVYCRSTLWKHWKP